ncbi:MAG TPA: hypothetical protein VN478_06250 [Clostridia bacterium]|nr:hypothetical protein [Clostridia bacterium]
MRYSRKAVIVVAVLVLLLITMTGCRHRSSLAGPVTSRDDAVARVTALPDVAAWIKLVQTESPANRVVIEVDSEDAALYTVHVYELVQDDAGGHSATFGWYEVVKATGIVRLVMP